MNVWVCWCIARDAKPVTTFFAPNNWGRSLLLCATHSDTNRQGHTFPVYEYKEPSK